MNAESPSKVDSKIDAFLAENKSFKLSEIIKLKDPVHHEICNQIV
jgi:hypothetical protein